MKKIHIFFANSIFVLHCVLAIFILTGWLFPSIKIYYLFTLLLWISSWIFLGYCPPTKWELLLRKKYDSTIDPHTEIIQFYMKKIFKKNISSKTIFATGMIVWILLFTLSLFS